MYTELFQPVGIGRLAFRSLMEQGLMRKIRAGTTFLEAGNDANNLTLIYSGTMNIISAPQDGRPPEPVGFVARMQFVESPQWANMQILQQQRKSKKKCTRLTTTSSGMDLSARPEQAPPAAGTAGTVTIGDEEEGGAGIGDTLLAVDDEDVRAAATVQVTFQAATDIVYYTWPMERLNEFLCRNPGLLAPVNALVGADVASKVRPSTDYCSTINTFPTYLPLSCSQSLTILRFMHFPLWHIFSCLDKALLKRGIFQRFTDVSICPWTNHPMKIRARHHWYLYLLTTMARTKQFEPVPKTHRCS